MNEIIRRYIDFSRLKMQILSQIQLMIMSEPEKNKTSLLVRNKLKMSGTH